MITLLKTKKYAHLFWFNFFFAPQITSGRRYRECDVRSVSTCNIKTVPVICEIRGGYFDCFFQILWLDNRFNPQVDRWITLMMPKNIVTIGSSGKLVPLDPLLRFEPTISPGRSSGVLVGDFGKTIKRNRNSRIRSKSFGLLLFWNIPRNNQS